jgi:thiamine-phosphate pyrophosphorylase
MKLHALVSDVETAKAAVDGGATVLQLRLKDAPTDRVVAEGRRYGELCAAAAVTFVVNDDVQAARLLGADGVHLGRDDPGEELAREAGLLLGLSAACLGEALEAARRGADYIGVGPIWATPTKPDAASPIGLAGLAEICRAVSTPVVAIGGIEATNAADCIRAGAAGIAVVRAAPDARALRDALDAAL